ncbi:hypothetical protein [Candidatus Nitrosoglobus terrae]|uniref:hypothetical protein n=1 Tax=Candidatus Nitrosoglobus terrae TaxID=1630141 RepID=UPI001552CCEF|nr:hypothetical protein [Candidatus Nitrosoglobus terrae]
MRRIVWSFGGRCDQDRAEHDGMSPCPSFRHLVDRLACVALDDRHLIDWQDEEIHLQTGLGAVRVVKVHRF